MKEVYIVSVARTPIGSLGGSLASLSATKLGSIAIKSAVERVGIKPEDVQEVYMGNVLTANVGQAPARQAALFAGLSNTTPCTTVNKVCASGTKAIILGAQSILLGDNDIVVAGGMESMSNTPYYLDKARNGYRFGHGSVIDGIVRDGLWDVYNDFHMGNAAEICAEECKISREEQDEFAIESYKRAAQAHENGLFDDEIAPVEIPQRKGDPIIIEKDEEYTKVNFEKVPSLKTVFKKDGTVTAANASTINDGAAAVVLMSKEKMDELGIKPVARILSFADAAQAPEWFTTAPAKAIPKAIEKAGLKLSDIDFFEINEAFSVVSIANNKELDLDPAKVNVNGGAVALGHPIGSSGARIVVTLTSVLKQKNAKYGAVGICNGGGGASAMVLEAM
ncbi:acetyl-CoA C-acyltransferase [Candidatus Amoebophilus asiaticus]|nr:acetyl-CoA C-acyltransferase [Candidatus Amoebophilus asiaticus]